MAGPPCARAAAVAFLAGGAVPGRCAAPRPRAAARVPLRLADVRGAGTAARLDAAARMTLLDVVRRLPSTAGAQRESFPLRGGGLRGGRYFETRTTIALRNVVYIPGVTISGAITEGGAATLTISGNKAARGHLRFRGNGRVTGVLDGKSVNGRIVSLAEPAQAATAAVSKHLAR
jgi:hypothetical protein